MFNEYKKNLKNQEDSETSDGANRSPASIQGDFSPLDYELKKPEPIASEMPKAPEQDFTLVPKDVYKLRDQPEDVKIDPNQVRASNAARQNPLAKIDKDFTLEGEPTGETVKLDLNKLRAHNAAKQNPLQTITPEINPSQLPSTDVVTPNSNIKPVPEVIGEGTSKFTQMPGLDPSVSDADVMPPPNNYKGRAGQNLGPTEGIDLPPDTVGKFNPDVNLPFASPSVSGFLNKVLPFAKPAATGLAEGLAAEYQLHPQYYNKSVSDAVTGGAPIVHKPNIPAGNNNDATTPPVYAPNQEPKPVVKLASDVATPDTSNKSSSPVESEEEKPVSKTEALLKAYRDLASSQGSGLKDAQAQAEKNQFNANLLKAANLFTSGVTAMGSHGVLKPASINNETLDDLSKQAQNPVNKYTQQVADQKNDPSSRYSQIMRQFLAPKLQAQQEKELGRKFTPEEQEQFDSNMSATPASGLEPIQKYVEAETNAQAKLEYLKTLKERQYQDAQAKVNEARTQKQNQALGQVTTLLESARGNPAARQAESDIYAAQKANSLANLYGDPNNLNPQMVQLLHGEIAKIAQGGSPTMSELQGLDEKTLVSKFGRIYQEFMNNPTKANAGAFVKQYQDYANQVTKDAQKQIHDRYGRIIETNKNRLSEDDYKHLNDNYVNRFNEEMKASKPGQEKTNNSKIVSKEQLKEYAKQHTKGDINAAQAFLSKAGYQVQ
jgi:hypothetical protein